MYQYILCLSKLPRAWADILLLRSGVLQPGLQYSKVTTGRVCALRKVGEEGMKAVMGRQMKLKEHSLCSHVYSTFFHHAHTNFPPPLPTLTHARIHSHLSSSSVLPDACISADTHTHTYIAHICLNSYTHKEHAHVLGHKWLLTFTFIYLFYL